MRKFYMSFFMVFCLFLVLVEGAFSFYFPPTHVPPGPPPNYTQIDTSYFLGVPSIPLPPPDKGGIYVWYDQGMWNFANHIYSAGTSLEQFHCCILAVLDQPPTPGVNVFAEGFELITENYLEEQSKDSSDLLSACSKCLQQNDRWGWKPWGESLYEIWWDVTTREWKSGSGDPNDFMRIAISGTAVDFNLWSFSAMGNFDADRVFLGAGMTALSGVPGYSDYFSGISDPYQSQAGWNAFSDPNITIFTKYSDTLRSYNKNGLIDSTDSYSCYLAENYGKRYSGTFAYEGNGIQFSTNRTSVINSPPDLQIPDDTSFFLCAEDSIVLDVCAADPNLNDTLTIMKISGPGSFATCSGISPLCGTLIWHPARDTAVQFVFQATDKYGAKDEDTILVEADFNEPPILEVPSDTIIFLCEPETLCFVVEASDPNPGDTIVLEKIEGPGCEPDTGITAVVDTFCFLPASVDSTYRFVLRVTDKCGATDTDTFNVTVDLNEAPLVTASDTVEFNLCDASTVCFDITIYDHENSNNKGTGGNGCNLSVEVSPPGTYNPSDTSVCFFADRDTVYNFTIILSEENISGIGNDNVCCCGAADTAYTVVKVNFQKPPVFTVPADIDTFLCEPETLCFDIDISGNGSPVDVEVVPPWHYNSDDTSICLFAPIQMNYCCIVKVTNSCQMSDTKTFCVNINLPDPPQVDVPDTILAPLGQTVKYSCTASDPDGTPLEDGATISVEPDCGDYFLETPKGGSSVKEWETNFNTTDCDLGWYQVVVEVQNSCGAAGSGTTYVKLEEPSDIGEKSSDQISEFFLGQNYPNPFNLSTEISFQLPRECKVELKIYNLKGQKVKTLVDREMNGGIHTLRWDGRDNAGYVVASGIYFFKLKTSDFECVRKMVLLK